MQINLNEIVTYKLTHRGMEILLDFAKEEERTIMQGLSLSASEKFRGELIESLIESNKKAQTRMQMWKFMKVFGPHMSMGVEPVTEGNKISIGEEKP